MKEVEDYIQELSAYTADLICEKYSWIREAAGNNGSVALFARQIYGAQPLSYEERTDKEKARDRDDRKAEILRWKKEGFLERILNENNCFNPNEVLDTIDFMYSQNIPFWSERPDLLYHLGRKVQEERDEYATRDLVPFIEIYDEAYLEECLSFLESEKYPDKPSLVDNYRRRYRNCVFCEALTISKKYRSSAERFMRDEDLMNLVIRAGIGIIENIRKDDLAVIDEFIKDARDKQEALSSCYPLSSSNYVFNSLMTVSERVDALNDCSRNVSKNGYIKLKRLSHDLSLVYGEGSLSTFSMASFPRDTLKRFLEEDQARVGKGQDNIYVSKEVLHDFRHHYLSDQYNSVYYLQNRIEQEKQKGRTD
jgi:hypothetical protein